MAIDLRRWPENCQFQHLQLWIEPLTTAISGWCGHPFDEVELVLWLQILRG